MSISVSASGAFVAGLLNFLASCLLPLVPLYLAHLGQSAASAVTPSERIRRIRWGSVGFVLSFALVFVLLGIGLKWLLTFSFEYSRLLEIGAGVFLLILTIPLIPHTRYRILDREWSLKVRQVNQPFLNGLALGAVFGFAWSPCIGPVLGAVLTVAAAQETYTEGVVLVSFYAAGLCVPFLLTAFLGESLLRFIRPTPRVGRMLRYLLIAFILLESILLLSGRAGTLFSWLTSIIRIGSL